MKMNIPVAIIIGSVIIAAAILIIFRWQYTADGMLLDRWTGTVTVCVPDRAAMATGKLKYKCE
jgi:hypothetical protein